jgi:hypothetical protein
MDRQSQAQIILAAVLMVSAALVCGLLYIEAYYG